MENQVPPATSPWHMKAVAAALGVGLLGFGGYAWHEHNAASQAQQQNAQVSASLKTTNSQVARLTTKLTDI